VLLKVTISRRAKQAAHVASIDKMKNTYILKVNLKGIDQLGDLGAKRKKI
jgi:hypothetical protein